RKACPGGHLAGPCQCGCAANAAVTSQCCSRHRGTARLGVLVGGGQGWRGDHLSKTDAYVRVFYQGREARTPTLWNNDRPHWGSRLDLGTVALLPESQLKVEVWDEDNKWDDDLLGVCHVSPVAARHKQEVVCYPGGGRLEFSYEVTCGPSLGGPLCHDYVPQAPQGDGGLYSFSHRPLA
ncbi:PERF protein, partial [Nycticryphes semicollaris]|nr:PERF protein [Nycticryphes semicollaris]